MKPNFLANFVQSVFDALEELGTAVRGGTLVVSGDGRYYNREAIQLICKMAAAAGVARIWIGKDGLLSTPAASAVVRSRAGGFQAFGALILSASHNPGGIDEDFGIKYNCENGGPAPEKVTDLIHAKTRAVRELRTAAAFPDIDLASAGTTTVVSADGSRRVEVEVFDSTQDHVAVLEKCFDLDAIRALFRRPDFSFCFDSLHGAQGPYARRVFGEMLGAAEGSLLNCVPKEDFGGPGSASHGHADPNLANARELCDIMGVGKDGRPMADLAKEPPSFGAAADGDADRNMILGSRFFVTPSDSLAVIVDNATLLPYLRESGIRAAARSMPTSCALDHVCRAKGIPLFETPTGWKFFGNLMDSDKYSPLICGEESFGTGSSHIREKDGMWAVLAWLQILAARNSDPAKPLVSVEQIVREHWSKYGRNYYARYDYEGVEAAGAAKMMECMTGMAGKWTAEDFAPYVLDKADSFEYLDPVDGSLSTNQGVRFMLGGGSRIVFRVSGTGVVGATVRLYLEQYAPPTGSLLEDPLAVVRPLGALAVRLARLQEFTGRAEPTVIT